ncbi:5-carboxymethyl-2-hydroxymuconate Delta-isomerase [Legionella sp. CNM-1927-20]|uniref:5-carboxymethyl-2-hydroxymuconate Delta-isomerase n=1 Tax=Legionella sp. CNM-1927-20 TaxID=3422221 RepID=UPI00403AD28C
MPHLVLEYSNNIDIRPEVTTFFAKAHSLLEKILPTQLASCKSRCINYDNFYIGSGQINNAMVHLTLKILPGRSDLLKEQVGQKLIELMTESFAPRNKNLNLEFSMEIIEASPHYFKG